MMEKNVQIGMHYGALADPIEQQLNRQGFTLGEKEPFINKLQEGLTICMFHILTESQYSSANNKMHKLVVKHAKPLKEGESHDN